MWEARAEQGMEERGAEGGKLGVAASGKVSVPHPEAPVQFLIPVFLCTKSLCSFPASGKGFQCLTDEGEKEKFVTH